MLRLFRNLRLGSLFNVQTRKYLLYAMGEILLVVIGILLALQVNNWNADRINRTTEKEVLGRVVIDLKKDLSELNELSLSCEERMLRGVRVLYKFGEDDNYFRNTELHKLATQTLDTSTLYQEDFGKLVSFIRFYYSFEKTDASFQEILSTGKLDLIRDPSLRSAIQNHYIQIDNFNRLDRLIVLYRDKYVNLLQKNGLSIINDMGFQEVQKRLGDSDEFIALLKDFLHISENVYQETGGSESSLRFKTEELILKLESYLSP